MRPRHSPRAGSGSPALRRGLRRAAGTVTGIGLLAILVVPTACFLLLAFFPAFFGQGSSNFTLSSFPDGYQSFVLTALGNSVWVSSLVAAVSLSVALVVAWLIERLHVPGGRFFRAGVWALLVVPTYLTALGLQDLLAPQGAFDWATGVDPSALSSLLLGPAGIVGVLSLRGLPFAYFAVSGSVRALGSNLEDAARVHGLDRRARLWVQVGTLMPALAAGFLLVFAESISDFGVASTLAASAHFPVITYAIFLYASTLPVDLPGAAAISWSLIGVFTLLIVAQRQLLGRRAYAVAADRGTPVPGGPRSGAGSGKGVRIAAPVALLVLLGAGLLGPLCGIAVSSLLGGTAASGSAASASGAGISTAAYSQVLHSPTLLGSITLSLRLALVAASIAVLAGLAVNLWAQFRASRRAAAALDLGLVAVIGLPSIVLGAGFIFFYNLPAIYKAMPIYDTEWLLLVGYVVGFAPVASRLMRGSLVQVGRRPFDAARVFGLGPVRAWVQGVLPIVTGPILNTWLFLVAMVMFELPLSEILHPPDGVPVAVAVAVTLKSQVPAGTALTVVAIGALAGVIALVLGARRGLGALSGLLAPAGARARHLATRAVRSPARTPAATRGAADTAPRRGDAPGAPSGAAAAGTPAGGPAPGPPELPGQRRAEPTRGRIR